MGKTTAVYAGELANYINATLHRTAVVKVISVTFDFSLFQTSYENNIEKTVLKMALRH